MLATRACMHLATVAGCGVVWGRVSPYTHRLQLRVQHPGACCEGNHGHG